MTTHATTSSSSTEPILTIPSMVGSLTIKATTIPQEHNVTFTLIHESAYDALKRVSKKKKTRLDKLNEQLNKEAPK